MADTVTVTCHTDGCGNANIPIEMPAGIEMDGEWFPTTQFQCGVCGQPIDDVQTPPAPDQGLPERQ